MTANPSIMEITLKSSLNVWLLTSFTFIYSFYWGFVLLSQLKYILTVCFRYTLSHFLFLGNFLTVILILVSKIKSAQACELVLAEILKARSAKRRACDLG